MLCVTIRTLPINIALSFFKFRKYYAAHNSGLKIWLVSGTFEMAQLFNLKFWLYLWRLGVAFSPHFQAAERCATLWKNRTKLGDLHDCDIYKINKDEFWKYIQMKIIFKSILILAILIVAFFWLCVMA